MKPAAIITMVHYEPRFLPIWLEHYSKHFASSDLYVIQHVLPHMETTPIEEGKCNVLKWTHPVGGEETKRGPHVSSIHKKLLKNYKTVYYTDVDEMLVPDPKKFPGGLVEYAKQIKLQSHQFRATGYEIIHMKKDGEPDLNWDERPILKQRQWFTPYRPYNKIVASRVPVTWSGGFHETNISVKRPKIPDPNLTLLHLKRLDYNYAKDRQETMQNTNVSPKFMYEWRIDNFDQYFYDGITDANLSARKVLIPEKFKSSI